MKHRVGRVVQRVKPPRDPFELSDAETMLARVTHIRATIREIAGEEPFTLLPRPATAMFTEQTPARGEAGRGVERKPPSTPRPRHSRE